MALTSSCSSPYSRDRLAVDKGYGDDYDQYTAGGLPIRQRPGRHSVVLSTVDRRRT